MEFFVVIIGLMIIFLFIVCIHSDSEVATYRFGIFCGWAMTALFVLEMICICEIVSEPHPKAIDVYQGKTTLKYEVVDGEIVDSVVVFKDNIYGKKD